MFTSQCVQTSGLFRNWERMAGMFNCQSWMRLGAVLALLLIGLGWAQGDTLRQVTAASALGANDTLTWSQAGADGTVLAANLTAKTAMSNSVTVAMSAPNAIISVVCAASPCSWTAVGFGAGHSLMWTSDAGNGGSGPVTLTFSKSVSGVGALIQADLPGSFTGEIQVYNGATLLATYTATSDAAGDPIYLGALDQSGPNISKVVFSMTTCASLCTDFGLDTVDVKTAGTGPEVTLTPASLEFVSTPVGSTTAAQLVTIMNSGTTSLNMTSETITGANATSFIKSATTCGATLGAAATCTVSVEFAPAAAQALTAALSIVDDAGDSPQTVLLSGTGTKTAGPIVSLSPASLTFAPQAVGSTSSTQAVALTNSGQTALSVTSIVASDDFAETNTCGNSLAAGANCTISVTFTPTVTGNRTGVVSVTDNAAGSPQVITLTGTGSSITVTSASNSGITITSVGSSGTSALQVGSVDGFSGSVNLNCTVAFQGTGTPSDLPTCSLNPTQAQVSAGGTANITLAVNTTAASSSMLIRPLGGGTAIVALSFLVFLPRRGWRKLTLLVLGFATVFSLSACGGTGSPGGGSGQSIGTTPGNYTVTVRATSGQNTASATVPLTIQ
jgi:hypothetical protein